MGGEGRSVFSSEHSVLSMVILAKICRLQYGGARPGVLPEGSNYSPISSLVGVTHIQ